MLKEVDGGRRLIKMAGNVVWRRFADDEGGISATVADWFKSG
jgi:hypothetical protein